MTADDLATLHACAFSATRAWSAAEFTSLLAQPGTILTGDTRCFALTRVTLDEAELLTIATAPECRRQGLARITLQAAENSARQSGATQLFLEVAEDNIAARTLYEDAGYRQIGRRPGYYLPKDTPPVAALVMCKQLPNA